MNSQVKTGLTHAGTAFGGAVATIAFMSQHSVDLYAMWNQLNVVVAEVTKLIALFMPFVTAAYGIYRSSTAVRLSEITNDPKAVEAAAALPVTPKVVALADALKKE